MTTPIFFNFELSAVDHLTYNHDELTKQQDKEWGEALEKFACHEPNSKNDLMDDPYPHIIFYGETKDVHQSAFGLPQGFIANDKMADILSGHMLAPHVEHKVRTKNHEIITKDRAVFFFYTTIIEFIDFPQSKFVSKIPNQTLKYDKVSGKLIDLYKDRPRIAIQNFSEYVSRKKELKEMRLSIRPTHLVFKQEIHQYDMFYEDFFSRSVVVSSRLKDRLIAEGITGVEFSKANFVVAE